MATALAAASIAAPQVPAVPYAPTPQESSWSEQAVHLLNAARRDEGLAALLADGAIESLAYQHAREMSERGRVTHHSYLWGANTVSRIKLAFPRVHQFAENVAANADVAQLHAALLRSPRHRANRLDPGFTHVGIGVAAGADGRLYQTEVFLTAAQTEPLQIAELYSAMPAGRLPRDEATTGEVASETIVVRAPQGDDPEAWTNRGIDAFVAGRHAEAVEHFRQALRLDPSYHYARFDLGRALLAAGRAEEARTTLREVLARDPGDLDALASLGNAELLAGDYAAAERTLRAVLQERLRDANAWYNLGLALELQRRPDEAERAYRQAIHIDPSLQAAAIALQRLRR